MNEAEKNYQVIRQVEDARHFLLEMYAHNPALLKTADQRIRELFQHKQTTAQTFKQRGISLVELIMFIVIVGIALAGILLVMNVTNKNSADPLIHKQALAIAESLIEEVELMPFTICDPDDPNASTGIGCATLESTMGPELGETRYSNLTPFDNVNDYHGFDSDADGGIKDITGNLIAALSGYSARIDVSNATLPNVAAGDALLVKVTVDGPGGLQAVVEGIRTRYAPKALP